MCVCVCVNVTLPLTSFKARRAKEEGESVSALKAELFSGATITRADVIARKEAGDVGPSVER